MIVVQNNTFQKLERQIRILILFFIAGLVLSGITAFPIESQLALANSYLQSHQWDNDFAHWIERVYIGVRETNLQYPFIAYGTDWLAFAHLVIATAFIGPLLDPVKNQWVIVFGLIACASIFPLAFIAGEVRGIPLYWRFLDCSFGLTGGWILWVCFKKIKRLEKARFPHQSFPMAASGSHA